MSNVLKFTGIITVILILIALLLSVIFRQEIARIRYQMTLFTGAEQNVHFVRQEDYYPYITMEAPEEKYIFPSGSPIILPSQFSHENETFDTAAFLKETDTAAFLILKDGQLIYENYWLTGEKEEPWHSHSLSKSFVSAAIGFAVRDGLIQSINDPITNYLPKLKNSGYNDVSIKNILQMSSGIRWNEDYSDPNSDLNQLGKTMALGSSYDELLFKTVNQNEPGTYNRYTGMDTQALTLLIAQVTDSSLTKYLENKLWLPIGAEYDAFWSTDRHKRELGLGGLNATARDFAKFGELYRLNGIWNGIQILPKEWIKASVTPDAPHLIPGENDLSDYDLGYGYQWWIPDDNSGDFTGIGIYNQFLYVSPKSGIVIVKLSCNRYYASEDSPRAYRELETFSLFKNIIQSSATN